MVAQTYGALTRGGAGGIPQPGVETISSGSASAGYTIVGGLVVPTGASSSTGGQLAGTINFSGGTVWTITLTSNYYSISKWSELTTIMALGISTLSGKTIGFRPGDYQWVDDTNFNQAFTSELLLTSHDQSSSSNYARILTWGAGYVGTNAPRIASTKFMGFYRLKIEGTWIKGQHSTGYFIFLLRSNVGNIRIEECEISGNYSALYQTYSSYYTVDPSTDIFTHSMANLSNLQVINLGTQTSVPTPLSYNNKYYAIVLSSTTFKIASSLVNAQNNVALDITSAGVGLQEFFLDVGFQACLGNENSTNLSANVTIKNNLFHGARQALNIANTSQYPVANYIIDGNSMYDIHTDWMQHTGGGSPQVINNNFYGLIGMRNSAHTDAMQFLNSGNITANFLLRAPPLQNVVISNNCINPLRSDALFPVSARELQGIFMEDNAGILAYPYSPRSFSNSSSWTLGSGWSLAADVATKASGSNNSIIANTDAISIAPESSYQLIFKVNSKTTGAGNLIVRVKQSGTTYATRTVALSAYTPGANDYLGTVGLTFYSPVSPTANAWTFEIEATAGTDVFSLSGFNLRKFTYNINHIVENNIFYMGDTKGVAIYQGDGCQVRNNTFVSSPSWLQGTQAQPRILFDNTYALYDTPRTAQNNAHENVFSNYVNSFTNLSFWSDNDIFTNNYLQLSADANSDSVFGASPSHRYSDMFVGPTFSDLNTTSAVRAAFVRKTSGPLDTASPKIGFNTVAPSSVANDALTVAYHAGGTLDIFANDSGATAINSLSYDAANLTIVQNGAGSLTVTSIGAAGNYNVTCNISCGGTPLTSVLAVTVQGSSSAAVDDILNVTYRGVGSINIFSNDTGITSISSLVYDSTNLTITQTGGGNLDVSSIKNAGSFPVTCNVLAGASPFTSTLTVNVAPVSTDAVSLTLRSY